MFGVTTRSWRTGLTLGFVNKKKNLHLYLSLGFLLQCQRVASHDSLRPYVPFPAIANGRD